MKIVLTFDTGYAPHAATVMESIIQNCPEKLDFAIIYYDLTSEVIGILTKHFKDKVKSIAFYEINQDTISKFSKVKNVPHIKGLNVFLRLLIPEVLPLTDKYALYLDCDIIVQDNILNITQGADLSKPICAVVEYDPNYKLRDLSRLHNVEKPIINPLIYEAYWYRAYRSLNLDVEAKYFNAGVMLINLDYCRKHNLFEKAIDFLLTNPERAIMADQDALNYAINGNFDPLHPKWNNFVSNLLRIFTNYPIEKLVECRKKPSIIHAAGTAIKLWDYLYPSKEHNLYLKYREFTPFKKINYSKITLKVILKKYFYFPIKNLSKFIIGDYNTYLLYNTFKDFIRKETFLSKARTQ